MRNRNARGNKDTTKLHSELPGATYPMEPLIAIELSEFCTVLIVLVGRILDIPKSPTLALMSYARRIFPGFKSQWIIGGWVWL